MKWILQLRLGNVLNTCSFSFQITNEDGTPKTVENPSVGFLIKHLEADTGAFVEEAESKDCLSLLSEPEQIVVKVTNP